jgi:malonyl-CoA O-methyltransferase
MPHPLFETLDPQAVLRLQRLRVDATPWLHEEVAKRMQERLAWIKQVPARWAHWAPLQGGLQSHALIAQRYPRSPCHVVQD